MHLDVFPPRCLGQETKEQIGRRAAPQQRAHRFLSLIRHAGRRRGRAHGAARQDLGVVWWVVLDDPGCWFVEFAAQAVESGVVFVVDGGGAGGDGIDVVPARIRRNGARLGFVGQGGRRVEG
ncbi:hypothetical protein BEH93_32895 [Streptomyces sp. 2R]|nr:hypothetical protein BEH93_32895 [Streptomyces sp. 2R]